MSLPKHQACPYCGHEVDDSQANWEESSESVECDNCHRNYTVSAEYKFLGFAIYKECNGCGETEENCYCTVPTE